MNARDMPTGGRAPEIPAPACTFRCLVEDGTAADLEVGGFVMDGPQLDPARIGAAATVVLPTQGAGRAASLLAAGARRVLLGEAALRDASLVPALVEEFGEGKVGLYVPARRIEVRWSFESVSNADFKVLAPSLGAPAWEVLLADGTGTGTQAPWWIGEMFGLGAAEALLRVDIRDDADLNLCADCVERFGHRIWIGPLADETPGIAEWIEFGHAVQLALPPALLAAHAQAMHPVAAQSGRAIG
jgi:imidazole glycerol phosphate synthase subunit HisF